MTTEKKSFKLIPVFLLGSGSNLLSQDRAKQLAMAAEILRRLGVGAESKFFIRKDSELKKIHKLKGVDGFVVFPCCADRFNSLIHLADSKLPVIIVGEGSFFANAYDTYEYLADRSNVELAFSLEEVKSKIKLFEAADWVRTARVCVFGLEKNEPVELAWSRNPIVSGKLNTCYIARDRMFNAYKDADKTKAQNIARTWAEESEVREPSLEDIVNSARVYLAMKTIMEEVEADAGYVYLCGNFTKGLGTKMCFAMARLCDDGIPVGCWRGENLLPMLILHAVSKKPVFVCEIDERNGRVVTLRHCFAPSAIADCTYVLRRWRDMKGTVTGYVQLPKGTVTLVNCGIGEKVVVTRARVLDCRDLGNKTCRMTVRAELENEETIRRFVGREFALVYGDYTNEDREVARRLDLQVLG